MDFLNFITNIFTNPVAGGGIVGLFGGLVQGVQNYKLQKLQFAQALELKKLDMQQEAAQNLHELELAKQSADTQLALGDQKLDIDSLKFAADNFAASMQMDKATYSVDTSSPWLRAVDVVRGFTRPVLTLVFDLALLLIFVTLLAVSWDAIVLTFQADGINMAKDVLNDIRFIAVTCTLWWFGGRIGADVQQIRKRR